MSTTLPTPRARHAAPAEDTPAPARITAALRAARGGALDREHAEVLLHARGDDLAELCALARPVRDETLERAGHPGVITYSRKVFVPITRLCRDRCHYCTFATVPGRLPVLFLSEDDVLAIARDGAGAGCKEALFTLGDAPEDRWPAARQWLSARGFASTIEYVQHLARRVLDETGLLPHLNPGVMSLDVLRASRPLAPSMGMMLETTSKRLWLEPGQVHFGSPDKDPDLRLRVLRDAGRAGVPFTSGVLVGIGETYAERVDSVLAIKDVVEEFGGIQEVIVQNFRAKDDTAMRGEADLEHPEYIATLAVSRLLLGSGVSLQAPPNLSDPAQRRQLLEAGVDDWGGVSPLTPDHVNPERPWPQLDDLAATTREAGFRLAERLTAHPRFVLDALAGRDTWIHPDLHGAVAALADPVTGLAREAAVPVGRVAA
nr:7,8-didemethyl-8-hydroxy-5-deazariboflavin synthase CofG [Kineococcus rhizosphaerae]